MCSTDEEVNGELSFEVFRVAFLELVAEVPIGLQFDVAISSILMQTLLGIGRMFLHGLLQKAENSTSSSFLYARTRNLAVSKSWS